MMADTIQPFQTITDNCWNFHFRETKIAGPKELLLIKNSVYGDGISSQSAFPVPDIDSFVASLRACARNKDLATGTSIQDDLVQKGLLEKCSGAVVAMYAKCGDLRRAETLLKLHESKDPFAWTALMAGYARVGQGHYALDCLEQMQREGLVADAVTYASALKACAAIHDVVKGRQIHNEIGRQGLLQNSDLLACALVDMYVKCGEASVAQQVLEGLPSKNVVSWNSLISAYEQGGNAELALDCFQRMQQQEGICPDAVTYICALKACASSSAIDRGKQIHDEIVRHGLLQSNMVLGGALVDMYVKCKALLEAQRVLDDLPSRNVILWNALITGYAQQGEAEQALYCITRMQQDGIVPDEVTYTCILKACAIVGSVDWGKQIHEEISRQGLLKNNIELSGALVDMYVKCGIVSKAHQVLLDLPVRDAATWNTLISGYAQENGTQEALNCFEQMQNEAILPDAVTYTCVLKACSSLGAATSGKQIHARISGQGLLEKDIELGTALVDMYAKCAHVSEACRVLQELPARNVISWNVIIAAYAQEGEPEQALNCLKTMDHEGTIPDAVTYASALGACATIRASVRGKQIHKAIIAQGLLQNNVLLGNALVDMYSKCGCALEAQYVLNKLPSRDIVSWNALIAGYLQDGDGEQVLNCFEQCQLDGILPDAVTYASALRACGMIKDFVKGKHIHDEIARQGMLQNNVVLGTALVEMYSKCSCISDALQVLQKLPSRNVVSWSVIIAGFAQEDESDQALNCFEKMLHEGIQPDAVTFSIMLNVFSHQGLVEKSLITFLSMVRSFGVKPNLDCYACMVDLFGRAGDLEEAVRLILDIPFAANMAIWHAVLHASWKSVDIYVGEWAFEQAKRLDKSDGSAYILMSKIS